MIKSPEAKPNKIPEKAARPSREATASKEKSEKLKYTPEQHAIRIQYEFLLRHPEFQKNWAQYSGAFREFFNNNKELCISLHETGDKEKIDDLCEIIKREVVDPIDKNLLQ